MSDGIKYQNLSTINTNSPEDDSYEWVECSEEEEEEEYSEEYEDEEELGFNWDIYLYNRDNRRFDSMSVEELEYFKTDEEGLCKLQSRVLHNDMGALYDLKAYYESLLNNDLNVTTEENNTKLEQITNFILQNNNKFSIQAFIKKMILEGINLTDDNIVYLAERFNGIIDVETFVFVCEMYREIVDSKILLSENEKTIDNKINHIFCLKSTDNTFNNITPKVIAIKHYLKNKLHNETIDENPLYSRIITVDDNNKKLENTLTYYLELSKTTKEPYYIHYNDGKHSRFFIIQNGKFAYIDSIANSEDKQELFDILNKFKYYFLGSQNISIQSDSISCRTYTSLGIVILDEYIKKYGIENLEELGKQVEFSGKELDYLFSLKQDKITHLNSIKKELRDLSGELVVEKEIKRKENLIEREQQTITDIKTTLQNTINQEKQENKENTSLTEQSLLKLLQLIDPERKSIDIDKDFEEIILLLNRVDLVNNKVFNLTHLLFPLAQTMTLVNSYTDHNEKLKEVDSRINDIREKVKVNHFVNDFREDILSRFNKIKELSERIDEQKLQNMKFFETPIDELPINEEKEEIEEEAEQQDKTTQEKPYPDFIYQHGNENIVALLEAVMSSTEMLGKYGNKVEGIGITDME